MLHTDADVNRKIDSTIAELDLLGYAKDFARMELGRGVAYHRQRVEMLGMHGDSVLDAGCGVGNWTLALAEQFAHVAALEYSRERLSVVEALVKALDLSQVTCMEGSIEALPYEDEYFDWIFCNGVLFLTDVTVSLAEFARVLKPGGKLYVTYNTKGWWRFLINVRGPNEPNCIGFGLDALEDRVRRLVQDLPAGQLLAPHTLELIAAAWSVEARPSVLERLSSFSSRKANPVERAAAAAARFGRSAAGQLLSRATMDAALKDFAKRGAPFDDIVDCCETLRIHDQDRWARLCSDMAALIWTGRAILPVAGAARCIEIADIEMLLRENGLLPLASGPEGTLVLASGVAPMEPIYPASRGVVETLAQKPIA